MTPPRPLQAILPAEPPVELGDTGRDLYAATLPIAFADAENAWAWANFVGALSTLLDVIAEMARDDADGNAGWTALGSPSRCPAPWLRVLAQWAGVHRWDSMTEEELRDLIGPRAPGLWRGTPAAMRDAVNRYLPAGAPVYFVERAEGDPYLLRVFTFDYIEHDSEQVHAALTAAKPAGLTLDYQVRHGQTWGMLNQRAASWAEVNETYDNWQAVYDDAPLGAGTDQQEEL
jgi:hypothetical protein